MRNRDICQFCPTQKNSFRNQIIIETPQAIAIHARRPLALGHTIIFPKVHRRGVSEMSEREVTALFGLIKKVINGLTKVFPTDSYNLFTNVGEEAGQTIPHVHFHVVLRSTDEQVNPFKILNNQKLYRALQPVTPQQLASNISKIKQGIKKSQAMK